VQTRESLAEAFADWEAPVRLVIGATAETDIVRTQIWDRPPSERWGEGPVTLLGDAAQPITPDLGQGACQAIESAAILSQQLAGAGSIPAAMRSYEQIRMRRSADVSRLCWLTSTNSTLEDPLLCGLRDAAMSLGLRGVARRELRWLLTGQVS
jgi:2-polyprenyl-6-methoxyphenol hydroxylase-like FAD-dependent oxidoreductase